MIPKQALSSIAICLVVLVCASCAKQPSRTSSEPRAVSEAPSSDSDAIASHSSDAMASHVNDAEATGSNEVTLRIADRAAYDALLQQHRGRVVLVDFWAMWCIPCVQAFPHTVEWYGKYRDQGLTVVSVSFDDPDESGRNPRSLEFLRQQGATFDNLLSRYGADTPSFQEFEIDGGGIPHYKLYDREGRLVHSFGNADPDHPLDPQEIEAAIRQTLGLVDATGKDEG